MAAHSFIGTWEVVSYGYINGKQSENYVLEGVRFRLDETGDVTWITTEELKSVPLFSCETYEIHDSPMYISVIIRFGAYAGHVIEFTADQIEPKDTVILTCDGWCMLKCKRILDEPLEQNFNAPFALLPAFEDGYFSDITIRSANNKEFKIHSCIVQLLGNDIDWHAEPPPFSGLTEDVLGTILHFLYAECLPNALDEATAREVIHIASQYNSLEKLVNLCQLFLKNMALKQQIIGLVNDMHGYINQVIEHFTPKNSANPTENITSNPSKLCFVMKQSVRDMAVAAVKLLLLCDLFTKRKNELTREERHEIIRYAKSRIPIFLTQLQKFLQALKNTFGSMTVSQRTEVASFLVPEIEIILETVSFLIVHIERALQQLIQVLTPSETSKTKSGVGDMLGKSLRNVLHIRELTKLKYFHEHITCTLVLLLHKKENFNEMTFAQKVRSVSRNLEQLIDELPFFLLRLEEVTAALDDRIEWRDFKFCFKVGTSKVSGVLQKLVAHQETLQDVMTRICELVQRDAFTQSVYNLGLLDIGNISAHSGDCKVGRSTSTPKQNTGIKLNLVESLCISPVTSLSNLSKYSLQLLKNSIGTDMEFEIVINSSTSEQTVRDHAEGCDQLEEERLIIKAHRVIVAARCDWFRRALLSGMKEAINRKIVVHDTTPFLFRIFLEYLYSGKLRQQMLSTEQLVEVLLLGDRYEVDTLKQACEYALQSSIDVESVLYLISMADQFNAPYLRHACLHFISQHRELTECEVFYELPMALQSEIFDLDLIEPKPKKSLTTEHLLANTDSPTSPDSSTSDVQKAISNLHFTSQTGPSNSSSLEDLPLSHDTERLNSCMAQLRDIVGDQAPREKLVQVILAADYDLRRAIHYFFIKTEDDE